MSDQQNELSDEYVRRQFRKIVGAITRGGDELMHSLLNEPESQIPETDRRLAEAVLSRLSSADSPVLVQWLLDTVATDTNRTVSDVATALARLEETGRVISHGSSVRQAE